MSFDGPVRLSPELKRILGLRRRVLDFESAEVDNLRRAWSRMLLNDEGKAQWDRIFALPTQAQIDAELAHFARRRDKYGPDGRPGLNCPLLLSGEQAVALYEAYHERGAFISAGVGFGKTLVSWLLSLIMGAPRPVLFVTGGLRDKTHDDFRDIAQFWQAPRPLPQIVSFEMLGQPNGATLLCDCGKCQRSKDPETPGGLRPTHVFADESDKFRDPKTATTRRMNRMMSKHPTTVYVGMSGTAWRKSIKNAAPQLIWALKERAPVPLDYVTMQEWSEALDLSSREIKRDPGALCWLAGRDPETILTYRERCEVAAEGFKNWLLGTPGVIQTKGQSCDQPIHIRMLKAPEDPILDAAFLHFRKTSTTLDGWDIDDPLSQLRHATEMATGFYYVWSPRPPQEWLDARREAATFVREKIKESARHGRPLDSKAPVYAMYPNEPVLVRWKAIEPTFTPNTVARPITASVLGYAAQWIKVNGPGLIWVQHDYVGKALSGMTGVPFFGSKGKDPTGRYIEKYDSRQSAIVSLLANERGRNLQSWNRNLVIGPHPAGTKWEQAIFGRTHRKGQEHPVYIDVLLSCAEDVRAVEKAYEEAGWGNGTVGTEQKFLVASFDWSHFPAAELESLPLDHPSRSRWARAA